MSPEPRPAAHRTTAPARCLVVGATGRLGRALRAAWANGCEGFSPIWQSRRPAHPGWVTWDPLGAAPMPDCDAVLGLAGVTAGDAGALALNTSLALRLCHGAQQAGARHVFLTSSAAVYGPAEAAPEDGATNPVNPYGHAKLAMEQAVHHWQAKAAPGAPGVTILRIGNVAGSDMLLGNAARGPVTLDRVAGQAGGPVRSYIGPGTLARVLAALVRRAMQGVPLPAVLNVAAPHPVAMADLLTAAGVPFDWRDAPAVIGRVTMDTARLQALVPFAPADSTAAGMVGEWRALAGGRP